MGYIFDALNKRKDQQQEDATAAPQPQDLAGDMLASAMAQSASTQTQPDAPLRLSDVSFKADSDNLEAESNTIFSSAAASEPKPVLRGIDLDSPILPEEIIDLKPEAIDPVLQTSEPVQLSLPAPQPVKGWWQRLLGRHLRGKVDDRLVTMTNPASAMAEEYRSIRTSILARHNNQRHLVHTITSATPQEGKTISCVNLGLSFAELRNRKTIIIECDLRLPTFSKLINCDNSRPGLIDYLRGQAKLADVIQQIEGSSLHILPAGGRVSDEAVQLLSSSRMTQLIQGLRAKYDHVFIDTPPVLQLADAGILGSQSEEVLLVARMRRTPRTLVEQAVSTLSSYNATVNGIIATDNPRSRGRGYGYKYGYGYRYGYTYGYTDDRKRNKQREAA